MELFYICGGALAGWAVLVSFLGIAVESFPSSRPVELAVYAVSTVLVIAAVGSGIVGSAMEEHGSEGEAAALAAPR